MTNANDIQTRVERVAGVSLPFAVSTGMDDALCVTLENGKAVVLSPDENALARGFFLLCRCVKEGRDALNLRQTRHFGSCGAMLDMSRGAVMTVDAVKRTIDMLACLGMNLLMLYTEDTYEVPEYPRLGYLRGRYSQQELRELDAYAASVGVELTPCIQTLGHMRQFLQWDENAPLRDQPDVLLCDDERVYALIEAQIRSISGCLRSRRIHIGMDEAHGVGLGAYLLKHGQTDRFQLLNRHLARVAQMCRNCGLRPMMWSDMFFRLGSPTNDYYDVDTRIPQHVIDSMPDVDMCYWDYYHNDTAFYDHMLDEHARMGGHTVFAGGIWTWSGFLPQVKCTKDTMIPALASCARHHVDTVFATLWGDDAAETNYFLAYGMLPIFSEACWQGPDCAQSERDAMGECLTGLPVAVLDAMGEFYPSAADARPGKSMIWGDPLYPLMRYAPGDSADAVIARARKAIGVLAAYSDRLECRYALKLFEVAQAKAELTRDLRARYLAHDRAYLQTVAEQTLPQLAQAYDALMRLHRELWRRDLKRFGWEVLCLRYGSVKERLLDAADELTRYLNGAVDTVAELDAEPLSPNRGSEHYQVLTTPSGLFGTGF